MKITITISLLCITLLLSSQNPQPYPVSDVNWSVVNVFPMGGWPPEPGMMTVTYGYYGFKQVGDYMYSELFHTYEPVFIPGDQSTYLSGYLREDDGYVIFMNFGQEIADTLYNFNLLPGDIATNFRFCCGTTYPMTVSTIDSVLINDQYHRRLIFDTVWDYSYMLAEVWIEGFGSIHGPLFPNTARLFSSEIPDALSLNCFSHDSQVIWQNPSFDQCYMNTLTAVPYPGSHSLKLFPNPATDYFTILLDASIGSAQDIRIYNLTGSLIISKKINSFNSQATIMLEGISPGIYFVEVINGDKRYISKLVRQ